MTPTPAGIALTAIGKTYRGRGKDVEALRDVTLDCAQGSFTALIGPSGCGKSTALRILLGLEVADTGQVRIAGQSPQQAASAGITGVAFQDSALLPWRSVASNITLPLEVLGRRVADYRDEIARLISLVGLKGYAGPDLAPPDEYRIAAHLGRNRGHDAAGHAWH